jgi:hypothetical protein
MDLLLNSEFSPLHSVCSIKVPHLEYSRDDYSCREDLDEFIPLELDKDEFNSVGSRNLDMEKQDCPSFHQFNSGEYELEPRLFDSDHSFDL